MGVQPLRTRITSVAVASGAVLAVWGCGSDPVRVDFRVTPAEYTLQVGESVQLSPVGAPGPVHWSSSNSSVVSVVLETGFVTALARGEAVVTATSGQHEASARIEVLDPPAIALSPMSVELDALVGSEAPVETAVEVDNGGDGTLEGLRLGEVAYAEEEGGWLHVELEGEVAPTLMLLEARPSGLPRGTYTAEVLVVAEGAANSPRLLSVRLGVLEPARIVFSPEEAELAGLPDEVLTAEVAVENGGDTPLTGLTAEVEEAGGAAPDWLSIELEGSPDAPGVLTLTASTAGLEAGEYGAGVRVRSELEEVESALLPVVLTVSPGPAIGLDPPEVSLDAMVGGDPVATAAQVTNTGGGTLSDLALEPVEYEAGEPTGWLTASLEGTEAPTVLDLTADLSGLEAGTYTARVPVVSPVASNSPRTLQVVLTVETRSFAQDVWPIFDDPEQGNCAACHSSGGEVPDLSDAETAYSNLVDDYVVPGDLEGSVLWCFVDWGDDCPQQKWMPPGSQLSDEALAIIREWIEQGADP